MISGAMKIKSSAGIWVPEWGP